MLTKDKFSFKINFRPIVVVFLSLLFGLISARKLYAGDSIYISLVSIVFIGLVIYTCFRGKFILILLFTVFFFLGNGMFYLSYNSFLGKEYKDADVCARISEVSYNDEYGYANLYLEKVVANGESVSGASLFVYNVSYDSFEVGDFITFKGDLEHKNLFSLNGFYSSYYRAGIAYDAYTDTDNINVVSGNLEFDENVRDSIKTLLYENMDERNAGVAFAVLTGDKDGVFESVLDSYRDSGIIHLLTVSGLHVTFLCGLIAWIFKKCKINRFINFLLTFFILLVYAYICGFAPSIVRAMIMGLVLISANLFGKWYDGPTSLSIAGLITLFISPLSALDAGFLMSYSCVGAIFILQKPFANIFKKFLPNKIADLIAISFATQIGILPFLASFFSELNLLSFFVNLLVIPFFAILFPLLVISVLFVLIFPGAGLILKICQYGFFYIEMVAEFFTSTSLKLTLKPFDPLFIALFFMILFSCSYFVITSSIIKWFLIATLTLLLGLYVMIKPELTYRGTSVAIIGTKYSNCYILESENGQRACVGYDENYINSYLAMEGLDKLDFIFVDYKVKNDFGAEIIYDSEGFAGDFKFLLQNGIYIFEFDDVKIFFTNLSYSSYNYSVIYNTIMNNHFDFAYFEDSEFLYDLDNCFLVSYDYCENFDYSYKKQGSFKYIFDTNCVWRID